MKGALIIKQLEYFLKYPFEDNQWARKLLIGGILFILPIINLISLGYLMQSLKAGLKGQQYLPEWKEWQDLFLQGLILFFITLVYLIIPAAISILFIFIPAIGGIVSSILFLLFGMMIPLAAANYLSSSKLEKAFDLREILYRLNRMFNIYFIAYFLFILIIAIVAIILFLPVIGIISILGIFYLSVVFFNFIGLAFYQST